MNRHQTCVIDPMNPGPTFAAMAENSRLFMPKCGLRRVKKGDYSKRLRERLREAKVNERNQAQQREEE